MTDVVDFETFCVSEACVEDSFALRNKMMTLLQKSLPTIILPAGKIAEKAMWRSLFLCIWHCISNADSTKTPSSSVTF